MHRSKFASVADRSFEHGHGQPALPRHHDLVVPVGALHQPDAEGHLRRVRRPPHQILKIGEGVAPVCLHDAAELHVGVVGADASEQLVAQVLRFVVLGVEMHGRTVAARPFESRAQPVERGVQRLGRR